MSEKNTTHKSYKHELSAIKSFEHYASVGNVCRVSIRIGRCPKLDIHFNNKALSWKHAEITANEHGLRIEDLSQNGTAVEMGGRRIDLEKNLPTQLALDCVILLPSRNVPRHAQEAVRIEICTPTASVPTEPPPPAQADEGMAEVAASLATISSEMVNLRTACIGNHTELYKQIQGNTDAITNQQSETVGENLMPRVYHKTPYTCA